MTMTLRVARATILIVLAGLGSCVSAGPSAGARPSLVFILADDLGWADLGCYGSVLHETPALDKRDERNNLIAEHPERVARLKSLLAGITSFGRSRP